MKLYKSLIFLPLAVAVPTSKHGDGFKISIRIDSDEASRAIMMSPHTTKEYPVCDETCPENACFPTFVRVYYIADINDRNAPRFATGKYDQARMVLTRMRC